MGLLRKVHREVTGAWRSACYDMYRHLHRRRMTRLGAAETAEFGPRHHKGLHVAKNPYKSRLAASGGVALLVAGGAAGTYLAVAGSLTALTTDGAQPPVAAPAVPTPGLQPTPGTITAPTPTRPRPQVRRSTPPQVIAMPEIQVGPPTEAPPETTEPESTPTPQASPSPSATASPSPSVSVPSASSTSSKQPKGGRYGDEDAASGQSGARR